MISLNLMFEKISMAERKPPTRVVTSRSVTNWRSDKKPKRSKFAFGNKDTSDSRIIANAPYQERLKAYREKVAQTQGIKSKGVETIDMVSQMPKRQKKNGLSDILRSKIKGLFN